MYIKSNAERNCPNLVSKEHLGVVSDGFNKSKFQELWSKLQFVCLCFSHCSEIMSVYENLSKNLLSEKLLAKSPIEIGISQALFTS